MADKTESTKSIQSKVNTIKNNLKEFEGKVGFNPFLWIANNLTPLVKEWNKTKSQATADKILALPDKPDCNSAQWNVNFSGTETTPSVSTEPES